MSITHPPRVRQPEETQYKSFISSFPSVKRKYTYADQEIYRNLQLV